MVSTWIFIILFSSVFSVLRYFIIIKKINELSREFQTLEKEKQNNRLKTGKINKFKCINHFCIFKISLVLINKTQNLFFQKTHKIGHWPIVVREKDRENREEDTTLYQEKSFTFCKEKIFKNQEHTMYNYYYYVLNA